LDLCIVPLVFRRDQSPFDVDLPRPLVEEGVAETVDGLYGFMRELVGSGELNGKHLIVLVLVVSGVPEVEGSHPKIAHSRRSILVEYVVPVLSIVLIKGCGVKVKQSILAVAQDIVHKIEPNFRLDHEMAMEVGKVERKVLATRCMG
jgi:hypothetical protein